MGGEPVERTREGVARGALTRLLSELAFLPEEALEGDWAGGLRAGDVVAERFELVREIGRGGFGVVFEARDRELSRSVAFKSVRAGGRPEVQEERLVREAEAAAQLSHPNLVTLFDAGRCEKGPYLVMELLRGRSLAARLAADGPLPPLEALRVATEVARGVAHAHGHGVIHRDLKPENVFLCDDGQVKVVDFGLALALGRHRAVGGTPAYMAPEQQRGEPEDERSDVYALGVMLHRMLSGALPGQASTVAGAPPAPAQARPEPPLPGPPALGALALRMRAAEPERRPRDGAAVLQALLALPRPAPRRPARRAGAAAAALVLLLALAGGAALWSRRAAPPAPGPASPAAGPVEPRARASAFSLTQRARAAFTEGHDVPQARRLLRQALTFDPGSAAVRFQLTLLGDAPEAIAAEDLPAWAAALPEREQRLLAALRARAADARQATTPRAQQAAAEEDRRRFDALVAAYPDDREITFLAGEAAAERGDLWGAAESYRQTLELDPGHLPALDRRFQAWHALGVWGRADELVRRAQDAVALRPTPASQVYLALAHAMRGDAEEAMQQARRAAAGESTLSLQVSWRLASVLQDGGAAAEAERVLRRWTAEEQEPATRQRAQWELARGLAARGRAAELRRLSGTLTGTLAAAGLPLALEGAARYASGDDAGAAEAWLRAAQAGARWPAGPQPALVASAAGYAQAVQACRGTAGRERLLCDAVLQWKRGDAPGAVQALQRVRAQHAEPLADFLLGQLHADQGDPALAAAALHRFLDLHDGFALPRPRARLLLAAALEWQGFTSEAREELARLQAELAGADPGLPIVKAARAALARTGGGR
ncbi:MAG: protein kinase [Anaeromyxobacter sp.]